MVLSPDTRDKHIQNYSHTPAEGQSTHDSAHLYSAACAYYIQVNTAAFAYKEHIHKATPTQTFLYVYVKARCA